MTKTKLTVKQIMELNLWDKVCEYKGWNPYALSEGRIDENEIVEFDSKFKKEEEVKLEVKWKDVLNCEKLFPKPMWECKEVAGMMNFEYILFNGLIYSTYGGDHICTEGELLV